LGVFCSIPFELHCRDYTLLAYEWQDRIVGLRRVGLLCCYVPRDVVFP
jgi:hypothetical protein